MMGMYVPAEACAVAVKLNWPEGLVSEAAYVAWTPPGNPTKLTSAVSLVEVM